MPMGSHAAHANLKLREAEGIQDSIVVSQEGSRPVDDWQALTPSARDQQCHAFAPLRQQ